MNVYKRRERKNWTSRQKHLAQLRTERFHKKNPQKHQEYGHRAYLKRPRPLCNYCGKIIPYPAMGCRYHAGCYKIFRMHQDIMYRSLLSLAVSDDKTARGCANCGYNQCGAALEWHHTSENKLRRITVRSYFTTLGEKERKKCVLLCANCHRVETHLK
jgi:hypothetical protein